MMIRRAFARAALRHKIHPNTVSEAYQDLVERHWLIRHRGKKMVVRLFDDLDLTI